MSVYGVYEQRRPCSAGRGLVHKAGKRVQPCLCYGKKRSPSAIFLGRTPTLFLISSKLRILEALKHFLDAVHVKFCLLKPWCETENYPLVDSRDLLPSFEAELWEYKGLPGFSMVAFARPLESFSEIFQYDILHPVLSAVNTAEGASAFGNARHRPQRPDVPEPPAQKTPGSFP